MNKPKCLSRMDLPTMQDFLSGEEVVLLRTEVLELAKWAVYLETQFHERTVLKIRFSVEEHLVGDVARMEIKRFEKCFEESIC
jgi:hypothetical protein